MMMTPNPKIAAPVTKPEAAIPDRSDVAMLVLRGAVGAVFIGHGAQKLFGMFGGTGLDGAAQLMTAAGLRPAMFFAVLAGIIELGGGLLLLAGWLTPLAGLAVAGNMVVAIITVTGPNGFFNQNEGYEFNLLLIAAALALVLAGSGRLSLDHRYGLNRLAQAAPWRSMARSEASNTSRPEAGDI